MFLLLWSWPVRPKSVASTRLSSVLVTNVIHVVAHPQSLIKLPLSPHNNIFEFASKQPVFKPPNWTRRTCCQRFPFHSRFAFSFLWIFNEWRRDSRETFAERRRTECTMYIWKESRYHPAHEGELSGGYSKRLNPDVYNVTCGRVFFLPALLIQYNRTRAHVTTCRARHTTTITVSKS